MNSKPKTFEMDSDLMDSPPVNKKEFFSGQSNL